MGWVIAIAVLALLALAPWFSADSRDDEGWKPLAGGVGVALRHVVRPFSGSPGAQAISRVTTRLAGLVHHPRRSTGRARAWGRNARPRH